MVEIRRWIVTYTKHLTQKRKTFQDGILEICGSGNKVMLYDDNDKVIDSRFLKKHEVIQSGSTLALEAHLVDISYPEEMENKPKKSNCAKGAASDGGSRDQEEWRVLYTNQVTKKAKKYHDGILRLSGCRSQMNQVSLLNDEGVILVSKYLKSVECIRKGNQFELSGNLIQICEPRSSKRDCRIAPEKVSTSCDAEIAGSTPLINNRLFKSPKIQVKAHTSSGDCMVMSGGTPMSYESSCTEWCALYSSQITKKTKSYRDGILRLSACGSHMNKVTLLSEDGTLLTSKHIKSVESIRTGNTLDFPNYLVEICERRDFGKDHEKKEAEKSNSSTEGKVINSEMDDKMLPKEDLQMHLPGRVKDVHSRSFGKSTNVEKLISNKPLRNACQILSILNRSKPDENDRRQTQPMRQIHMSQSSNCNEVDVKTEQKVMEYNAQGEDFHTKAYEDDDTDVPQELNKGVSFSTNVSQDYHRQLKVSPDSCSAIRRFLEEVDVEQQFDYTFSNLIFGNVVPDRRTLENYLSSGDLRSLNGGSTVADSNACRFFEVDTGNESEKVLIGSMSSKEAIDMKGGLDPERNSSLSNDNRGSNCPATNHLKEKISKVDKNGISEKALWSSASMPDGDFNLTCGMVFSQGVQLPACNTFSDKNKVDEVQCSPNRMVALKIFHGGKFVRNPRISYVDGYKNVFHVVPESITVMELQNILKGLKCWNISKLFYVVPGLFLGRGLRLIYNDESVSDMLEHINIHGKIKLYVEHK